MSNLQKYEAGFNPTNSAAYLHQIVVFSLPAIARLGAPRTSATMLDRPVKLRNCA